MSGETAVKKASQQRAIAMILEALESLEYGQVVVTVHNRQVVQVEKTEKIRFPVRDLFEKGAGI